MKRSRSIRLVLIGSSSLLALAGCDQSDVMSQSDFVKDEAACEAKYNPGACRQALADARQEHLKTAPAFANREECEAQFGADNCAPKSEIAVPNASGTPNLSAPQGSGETQQQASSGGSWFMPIMMGYMMGRMMGGGMGAQAVYRDTDNRAYTGANKSVGRFDNASMPPPRAPASSVARGGFGRSATGTVSS